MAKGPSAAASPDYIVALSADRNPIKDNIAVIPNIASVEQFKCFIDELKFILGRADVEKCLEMDVPSTFLIGDLFIYPLAFRVIFKFPFHPLGAEFLRCAAILLHRIVPNL